ncbi:ATP-dependent RNA helicase mss116, mitochondrial [Lecanosticta acicola]|uniref:ATP-dependent RNA helicase n=1 Tax=Lecanosticta acicola TaxID=111012 RepID=A0AAI8YWH8_9PEZI|nr:ATP-dependent RNA helicase mss116, mitochondrial [Lecanosticta acicola]
MRRSFQRCAASLSRTISSSNGLAHKSISRAALPRHVALRAYPATRRIHQSSIFRQQAAAQATEAASSGDASMTRFADLERHGLVHPTVVRAIKNMGIETMTDVQRLTITQALKGQDMIAQARTGTGKTLAFLLPILQRMIEADPGLAVRSGGRRGPRTTADDIRGLVISPTRELAEQIAVEAKKLTANTGIVVQTAVGGTQKMQGLRAIQREGCHLLVGTPGRLKDLLTDSYSRVQAPDLDAFVLDEADRLLDQGFWPEIQEIMHQLPAPAEKDRQTLMFSATVPKEVVHLVRSTLKPGFQFVKTVRDDEQPTHERVPQKLVRVGGFENLMPSLIELCQREIDAGSQPGGKPFKGIVYFNSTAEVRLAAQTFHSQGNSSGAFGGPSLLGSARALEIHAKLTQPQRQRAADDFRACRTGLLLSTDVTARGMDFPNVTHVIQVGLPTSREQYIHRIGRTGRAGKEGEAWILLNELEDGESRRRLQNLPIKPDDTLSIPNLDLTKAGNVPAHASKILSAYQQAIQGVSILEKSGVYLALLGVYQWFTHKDRLVRAMNDLSQFGWGLSTPPTIPPGLAERLRIARIPGVRIDDRPSAFGGDRSGGNRDGGRFSGERFDNARGGGRFTGERYDNARGGGRFTGGRGGERRDSGMGGGSRDTRGGYGRPSYGDRGSGGDFGRRPARSDNPF